MSSFILNNDTFLHGLGSSNLRKSYQDKAKVNLNDPSPSVLFTSVGYKDTSTRNYQVNALEWLYHHFNKLGYLDFELPTDVEPEKYKSNPEKVKYEIRDLKNKVDEAKYRLKEATPESTVMTTELNESISQLEKEIYDKALELQNYKLEALRVLTGACIYITETNKTGELVGILNTMMGVNSVNKIDSATRALCLNAAKEHLSHIGDASRYGDYGLKGIDFEFFANFFKYAEAETNKRIIDSLPVAKITSLSLAWSASMVGYSIGALAGQAISNTTTMQNTQWKVTAVVGGFMYFIMGGATAGITLLAPTIARNAISNACGLSAALAVGKIFEYFAYAAGFAIGAPIDLVWKFAKSGASATYDLAMSNNSDKLPSKGVSLQDGTCYLYGQPYKIEVLSEEKIRSLKEEMTEFKEQIAERDDIKQLLPEDVSSKDMASLISELNTRIANDMEADKPKPAEDFMVTSQESETAHSI